MRILLEGSKRFPPQEVTVLGGCLVERPIAFRSGIYFEQYVVCWNGDLSPDPLYTGMYIGLRRSNPLYIPKRPVPLPD